MERSTGKEDSEKNKRSDGKIVSRTKRSDMETDRIDERSVWGSKAFLCVRESLPGKIPAFFRTSFTDLSHHSPFGCPVAQPHTHHYHPPNLVVVVLVVALCPSPLLHVFHCSFSSQASRSLLFFHAIAIRL